ncbi:hypothetical protein BBBOND_0207850 [Babesia bigemina]|uniref:Uncharacterized protein n=1 Tax=Babesia bigemina TaxID=5866 RepID=A0A061D4H7_BABBI|nr:hypothetical protein BBBOND_0207850 [Babesia bigemina]CDR95631.1 hypothetical protein BBBOND_0207850 [Babesia bigemina]|eukprot:XP_012767817.1 hypothetical protein BBBOND_0207850 [Babesia bigemina]
MAHNSLTDAPRNFREGIDWLLALKGRYPDESLKGMGEAVYQLFKSDNVSVEASTALQNVHDICKTFLDKEGLNEQFFVKEFLHRLARPMNKKPGALDESPEVSASSVTKDLVHVVGRCEKFLKKSKLYKQYPDAYTRSATWNSSCAQNPEACAVVLVGIAPMLYTGLRSLQVASAGALEDESDSAAKERMGEVLKAVGFDDSECPASNRNAPVHRALRRVDERVFTILHNLAGFWVFN